MNTGTWARSAFILYTLIPDQLLQQWAFIPAMNHLRCSGPLLIRLLNIYMVGTCDGNVLEGNSDNVNNSFLCK